MFAVGAINHKLGKGTLVYGYAALRREWDDLLKVCSIQMKDKLLQLGGSPPVFRPGSFRLLNRNYALLDSAVSIYFSANSIASSEFSNVSSRKSFS